MYLVDAKANANVTSIASVSGGSLTNGFIGQTLNFRETDGEEFRQRVASPLATQIAKAGTLFAPLLTKAYLAALTILGLVVPVVTVTVIGPWYLRLLTLLIGMALWGWLFGLRGKVCAFSFSKTLFSPGGRESTLAHLRKNGLDHVICSTELGSAEQVFFAGDFVYSYRLGHSKPADISLATAVQASAAYPGGFPPTTLPIKRFDFKEAAPSADGRSTWPAYMELTDGSVYDNMGDQWARGFAARINRWRELGEGRTVPDQLMVVNAAARVSGNPFKRLPIPLLGEVKAFLRVLAVMLINTSNVSRQIIVASYNPTNPADPTTPSALPSVLVQITQSPYRIANTFATTTGPVSRRARTVLDFLSNGPTSDEWAKMASDNSAAPTTFSKMGTEVSARLIYQGYVVTMCNLHVLFGDDFPLRPRELSIERFRELIA